MKEDNKNAAIDVVAYMHDMIEKHGWECLEETIPFSGKDAMLLFSCFQRVIIVEASLLDILSNSGAISKSNAQTIRDEIDNLIQRADEFAIDFFGKLKEKHNG